MSGYIANFPRGRAFKIGTQVSIRRLADGRIVIHAPRDWAIKELREDDAGVPSRPQLPSGDEADHHD